MRLNPEQIQAIVETTQAHALESPVEIYLYGSRVDENLKGGDIDLLFLSDEPGGLVLQDKKYQILNAMKKHTCIGDRKIDLLIATKDSIATVPFLKQIKDKMKKLG